MQGSNRILLKDIFSSFQADIFRNLFWVCYNNCSEDCSRTSCKMFFQKFLLRIPLKKHEHFISKIFQDSLLYIIILTFRNLRKDSTKILFQNLFFNFYKDIFGNLSKIYSNNCYEYSSKTKSKIFIFE